MIRPSRASSLSRTLLAARTKIGADPVVPIAEGSEMRAGAVTGSVELKGGVSDAVE
jgi:hypothetical protein